MTAEVGRSSADAAAIQPRPSPTWLRITVAVSLLVATSSAPWIFIQFRVIGTPMFGTGWPYVYSYWGVGICAAALFVHDVAPTLASRSPKWWIVAPTLALGGWALLSAWWTLSPDKTANEALLMVVLLLGALWLGYALDVRMQAWVLYGSLHALVAGSYVVCRFRPEWGVDPYGSWHGLFANRNTLGPTATLAMLVALAATAYCRRWSMRALVLLPVLLDIAVARRAGSVTAWLALAAGAGVAALALILVWARRRGVRRALLVGASSAVLIGLAAAIPLILSVLGGLGRGETLSGRRVVWDFAIDQARSRPWQGYGFASFWDHPDLVAAFNAETNGRWDSGHSSFVDTLLWCGSVGLVLLVLMVGARAIVLARNLLDGHDRPAVIRFAILAFLVVENLAESMIGYHALFWVLLVAMVGGHAGVVGVPEPSGWDGADATEDANSAATHVASSLGGHR